jgi:hypothetical protein
MHDVATGTHLCATLAQMAPVTCDVALVGALVLPQQFAVMPLESVADTRHLVIRRPVGHLGEHLQGQARAVTARGGCVRRTTHRQHAA